MGDGSVVDREHPCRCGVVDVLTGGEGLDQPRVLGQMGDDPELDLVVVRHQELGAGRRDERFAEATALF